MVAGCSGEEVTEDVIDEPEAELEWELDAELDSNLPPCTPDDPECDRIDEPDISDVRDDGQVEPADEGLFDDELGAGDHDDLRGLTDPLAAGKYRRWPNGRIPYRFAKYSNGNYQLSAATRSTVSKAMTNWEKLTEGRIKFRAKTTADTAYVLIKLGSPRVQPFIGYRKGQVQELYLRQGEYITVTKHELGHVVGLHHEQRRKDRGSFIRVRTANIVNTTSCKYQFSTCTTCPLLGTYDRSSVMHYRTSDLGNCRTGPVLTKLDGSYITHYWQLSKKDLSSVAKMYYVAAPPPPTTTPVFPETGSLVAGGLCADVAGRSTLEGAKIMQWSCNGGGNQDWRTTRGSQLRAQHSLRCSSVVGESVPGAVVEQAICAAEARQQWQFRGLEIVNAQSKKCFEIPNANYISGQRIAVVECTGAPSQQFDYRPDIEALGAGGLCVTARDGFGDDVTLRTCDGRVGQKWFQGRGGFVSRANTGECMSVEPVNGNKVEVAGCTDELAQRWGLRGPIRDSRSGLCLEGASKGQQLRLATCDATTAAAQTWTFWSR